MRAPYPGAQRVGEGVIPPETRLPHPVVSRGRLTSFMLPSGRVGHGSSLAGREALARPLLRCA